MVGTIRSRRAARVLLATAVAAAGVAVLGSSEASAEIGNPGPVTATLSATLVTADPATPDLTFSGSASGTISAAGALEFPAAGMSFGASSIDFAGQTITVNASATTAFTGTLDPESGAASLSGGLQAGLTNAALGLAGCPIGPFTVALSTAEAGGVPYNSGTGAATLADAAFAIPAIPAGAAGCGGLEAAINPALMLPNPASGPITLAMTLSPAPVVKPPSASAPNAVSSAVNVNKDTPSFINVMGNVTKSAQFDIDTASLKITKAPTKGTATVQVDRTVYYVPTAGAVGTDSFEYSICSTIPQGTVLPEGESPCDTATVSITIVDTTPVTTAAAATTTTTAPKAAATLPETGRTSGSFVLAGVAALGLGAAALGWSRKRRTIVR